MVDKTPDPAAAVKTVLDGEIALFAAEVEKLKQTLPPGDPKLEAAKNKLRARQIQRAKLGP